MCSQPHINYLYINLYIYLYIFKYIYIYIFFCSPQRVSFLTKNTLFRSFLSLSLSYTLPPPLLSDTRSIPRGKRNERSRQGNRVSSNHLSILSSLSCLYEVPPWYIPPRASSFGSLLSVSASFPTWPRLESAVRNIDVRSVEKRSFWDDADVRSPKIRA